MIHLFSLYRQKKRSVDVYMKIMKRIISLLICVALVLGYFPVVTFAEDAIEESALMEPLEFVEETDSMEPEEEAAPIHEHEYTAVVTNPTCSEQGYTTYTCDCGDTNVDDYVNAKGHSYAEGNCTVCSEADPDYSEPAWGTWVAFGTSITEDKDYMRPGANVFGTYIPYLSNLMGVDAPDANYSIAGAGFSTHLLMYIYYANYQKNGLTYNGYTHTAIKNADLITIEGGVNDFYGGVPLGKVGDTLPYSKADPIAINPNSTNNFGGSTNGTFAGCIYAAITELRRIAPDATIVFITDNAGTDSCAATKANKLGYYLYDYNDMMIAVAESMGCYVIDAGRTAGFEENLKTYLSDHINHSEAGGEAYANAIYKGLCAIQNGEKPESGHTHRYSSSVTGPTCTQQGYTTYICDCGDHYKDAYTNPTGHNYAAGSCSICGEADPDYLEPGWETWVAFGTSITEDNIYWRSSSATALGTYIPYLSALMGVDAPDANYSIGGGAFSGHLLMYMYNVQMQKTGRSYNGYTHTAIKNADLITIEGGVNDFYGSVPLGEVGDTLPYSKADPITVNPNSTNNFGGTTEGTFAGCIYAAITELRKVAPDATIVFITDNAGTGSCAATKANALGHYLHDYNDMMTAVAESMGCFVIDAGRTAGFEENLITYLSDHIHHSEAGGEAYANAIWKGLCAIRNGEKPESGHTHRYTESVTAPTCTEKGYTTYTCDCGDSYADDYVDADGEHDFTDWYTTKEAAYNADGEESRDCKKCSHVEFRSVKLEVVTSGNVGYATPYSDDVIYTLYADGTMVISGKGIVYCSDWRGDYQPYKDYRTQVKTLIVEEGITATSGGCFAHFYNLETVSLPDSITKIDGNAFMSSFASSITSIVIPKTVTYIGAYSYGFYYGKGGTTFTDIIIENPNVRFADNKAVFNSGNNLENLTLYSYGTSNNVSAYAEKYGCKYVDLEAYKKGIYSGVEYMYYDGVLNLSAAQTDATIAGEDAPWNAEKNNIHKIVIESGITSIAANAFKDYYNLESIEINNEIRHVGDGAFSTTETCDRALNLALPRTVKSVGRGIFAGRKNITLTAYLGSAAAEINESGVTLDLKKQFKLLLIGNSYSEDASSCGQGMQDSQLLNILQAMLGEEAEVTVALLSSGGKGINWHATQAEQGNAAYSFKIISSNSPTWTTIGSASSYQALTWTDWDVVSIQPYNISASTGIEAVPYPDSTDTKFRDLKTASEYLLDYIDTHAPDADIYCYMHWAQTTGTTLNANLSYYNRLAPHYLAMMEHAGTTTGTKYTSLIPVGLSIQNARSTYLALLAYNTGATLNLTTDTQIGLQRDGGHLSFNVGRYIAGLTFAEMIVPNDWRVSNYVLPEIRITESVGKLPKEYSVIAQKAVFAAVNTWKNGSLAVTNIDGYTQDPTVAAKQTLESQTLMVTCTDQETMIQQIRENVLAELPADFSVDAVLIDRDNANAAVTIRFGYTSAKASISWEIENHCYENGICTGCGKVQQEPTYGTVENRVEISSEELGNHSSVWIDGKEYSVQQNGDGCYVDLPDSNARVMTTYTYHVDATAEDGVDAHRRYPVGMKVWTLENQNGVYTATRQSAFDDILQYSGMAIRITGKQGIRMITSVDENDRDALIERNLAGYTLKEYGTAIAFAGQLGSNRPLVLNQSYVNSNYAYKKDVADPIFRYVDGRIQYTNVIVGFSLDQCKKDIAMRPYMILEDAQGNEITIYGGIVERSIGYIALLNRLTFKEDTDPYDYVWEIIHAVYGDAYDADWKPSWSDTVM